MKYLLSWLLDHINLNIPCSNELFLKIKNIVSNHVAEIEHSYKIEKNLDDLYLIEIKSISNDIFLCFCEELNLNFDIKKRSDLSVGDFCFISSDKELKKVKWASSKDFGGDKDNLLPSFEVEKNKIKNWKNFFPKEDFILSIDNKSIGHRPDLWGHRGLAREIAFHLNSELKEENNFLKFEKNENFIKLNSKKCSFYSALKNLNFYEKKSDIFNGIRLSKLDCKPISFLVDLSNYVMFDLGHPLNVFDAEKVKNSLVIRDATENEKMILRDGNEIKLSSQDLIISDSKNNALVLAGISCGKVSSVSIETKKIHLEAAVFDKVIVRNMSKKFGIRSESSSRIEKGLTSGNALAALNKFFELASAKYETKDTPTIFYNGKLDLEKKIEINHQFLEKIIGIKIDEEKIFKICKSLGFKIEKKDENYFLNVPFWRTDISIKEDFVEEISRHIGYSNIEKKEIIVNPKGYIYNFFDFKLKDLSKNYFNSKEVYTYGISNNDFELKLKYFPEDSVNLKNGYSEIQNKLSTTKIPNLVEILKNKVLDGEKEYSVFEVSSVFKKEKENQINSKNIFSILIYSESENKYDFYKNKNSFIKFFNFLNPKNSIIFKKFEQKNFSFMSELSADIYRNEFISGFCGFIKPELVFDLTKRNGSIFALEIEIEKLQIENKETINLKNYFDISIFLDKNFDLNELINLINLKEEEIISISPIDFFEKNDWIDKRSVTLRFFLKKTFNENIYKNCKKFLEESGCKTRE